MDESYTLFCIDADFCFTLNFNNELDLNETYKIILPIVVKEFNYKKMYYATLNTNYYVQIGINIKFYFYGKFFRINKRK